MRLQTCVRAAAAVAALSFVSLAGRDADAAVQKSWTGSSGDLKFGTAANWSDSVVPGVNDFLTFGESGSGGRINNNMGVLQLTRITFAGFKEYILEGGGILLAELTVQEDARNKSIELNLAGATRVLVAEDGQLTLAGGNSFTGDVDIIGGVLFAATANALGSSAGKTTISLGGRLDFAGKDLGDELIRIAGNNVAGSCSIINHTGDSVLRNLEVSDGTCFLNAAGNTLNYPNGIKQYFGPMQLDLFGGTHIVGGATNATGTIRVSEPTNLVWNSTAAVDLRFQDFETLIASGNLSGSGTATSLVFTGDTFAPGAGNASGRFTLTGSLTLESANFSVRMNAPAVATGYSQATAGSVAIGPNTNLVLVQNFNPSVGQQFRIIDNTGTLAVNGTFAGLPEGAEFVRNGRTYKITYKGGSGNDVVIERIEDAPQDPFPHKARLPMLAKS